MATTKRLLLETRLDEDLGQIVRTRRTEGASWFAIRDEVEKRTGLTVSHQSLINWFGDRSCNRDKAAS